MKAAPQVDDWADSAREVVVADMLILALGAAAEVG